MTTSPACPDPAAEADSLDQWLESGTTGSTPAHGSLADVARRFHARMASAELAASPAIPTRAISARIAAGTARTARLEPRRLPAAPASGRWQTWTTAALVLAVAIAVAALFQVLAGERDNASTPAPTILLGANPGTPAPDDPYLVPLDSGECDIEPRPLDEVSTLMRAPVDAPPRSYEPVGPADPAVAAEVATTSRALEACHFTGAPGAWRALASPRFIYERQTSPPYGVIPPPGERAPFDAYIAYVRTLSGTLLDPNRDYSVVSDQDAPLTDDGDGGDIIFAEVLLPQDLVRFADGRIGGPMITLLPANHEAVSTEIWQGVQTPTPLGFTLVTYRWFVQDPAQDGRWMLDEALEFCLGECGGYYAMAEEFYRAQQPILPATPGATLPAGSAQADDCALVPILYANGDDDCTTGDDGFMVEVDPTAEGTTGDDGFWVIPEPPPERTVPQPPEMQPGTLDW